MTKALFKRRFPQGLNCEIVNFEKALYKVMTTEEIDHIIAYTKNRKEKRWLKKFKETYNAVAKDWDSVIIWPALHAIKSVELLKNVIAVMVTESKNVYMGEDEND